MNKVKEISSIKIKAQAEKLATLAGHRDCIYTLCAAKEDKYFFSAAGDGLIALWDLSRPEVGELVAKVPNSVYAIALYEQKNQLIVGQNFEGIHLIDIQNKEEINSAKITDAAIFDIQVYKNFAFIACGDGVLIIFDIENWASIKHIKASDKSVRSIAFNEKNNEFALGYSDNQIRIFDLSTFELKKTIKAHENSIFTLAYTKEGAFLLSAGRDAHLKVWDSSNDYQLIEDIPAHLYAINHIVFSPTGRVFATASMDKSIKVWDSQTFKLIKVIDKARHAGHGTSVNKLLWSKYNSYLVSGSDDRSVSVWDLRFYTVS